MTFENWQNLFGALYALLGCILFAIVLSVLFHWAFNKDMERLNKENKQLRKVIEKLTNSEDKK